MEHEEAMDKRKTNPNAADADYDPIPKKIHEELQVVSAPESKQPHEYENQTVLEFLFKARFVDSLAHRLMKLELSIDDLMDSLSKAARDDGGGHLQTFALKLKDHLLNSPDFLKACVDTYFEDKDMEYSYYLFICIQFYKAEKQPHQRMECLRDDPFFHHVLGLTEPLDIARGVSSVFLGYWCDDAFYRKMKSVIIEINQRKQPQFEPATFSRKEVVVGIDFPATIEGLKDAFFSMYPPDEARFICRQIEGVDRREFKSRLCDCEGKRIKGFVINVQDKCFRIPFIWFSYDHWVLRKYMTTSTDYVIVKRSGFQGLD